MQTCVVRLDGAADLDERRLARRRRAVERPDHRRGHVDEARPASAGVPAPRRVAVGPRGLAAAEADREARRLELELVEPRLVDEAEDLLARPPA